MIGIQQNQNLLRWSLKHFSQSFFSFNKRLLEFTPLEFETPVKHTNNKAQKYQNLLRWSLKQIEQWTDQNGQNHQNLLRWSLKPAGDVIVASGPENQNLLRWSLKLKPLDIDKERERLEFTPLEFETKKMKSILLVARSLEFTPLEFETEKKDQKNHIDEQIRIYSVGV